MITCSIKKLNKCWRGLFYLMWYKLVVGCAFRMETQTDSMNVTHDYFIENDTLFYSNQTYFWETQQPPQPNHFTDIVYTIIIPSISVLGVITNLFTFSALVRPPLNTFSPSIYLAAYCIASALVCGFITGLGYIFEINNWQEIELRSSSSCKIWAFVRTILNSSPNWLLTGAAMDRIVAVWCPKRSQSMVQFLCRKSLCVWFSSSWQQ